MAEGRDDDARPNTGRGASTSAVRKLSGGAQRPGFDALVTSQCLAAQPVFEPGQKVTCIASFDGQQCKWLGDSGRLGPSSRFRGLSATFSRLADATEIVDRRIERGEYVYYVHYIERKLTLGGRVASRRRWHARRRTDNQQVWSTAACSHGVMFALQATGG